MKQINLAAYADGNAASPTELPPRIAANATVAVPGQREVRQFSATVWIVAAWLIASLAWELQVLGAEPQLAVPVAGNLVAQKSMLQQWEARATEFAITHSGIVEFDRIQRDL